MKLRTLIIEDNPDDALLAVCELEKAGHEVTYLRVQTADEVRDALASQVWDVVK